MNAFITIITMQFIFIKITNIIKLNDFDSKIINSVKRTFEIAFGGANNFYLETNSHSVIYISLTFDSREGAPRNCTRAGELGISYPTVVLGFKCHEIQTTFSVTKKYRN